MNKDILETFLSVFSKVIKGTEHELLGMQQYLEDLEKI